MGLNPKGRDWGLLVNWDDLGKAYAGFIISWTVLLLCGMIWLLRNRHLSFIKIRNVPLAIAATGFLHIYLIKICLAYTTNGHFLCSAEFWIMSIYLPFGIALFQANLAQLRNVSDQQKRLLSPRASLLPEPKSWSFRGLTHYWHNLPEIKRSYIVIGAGMLVQLIITATLYSTTPTLQGHWSSFGKVTHAKGQALCRKSYQWIPSAFWQLAWSWLYGPYILFKIRNIHDLHHWRLQTILSVLSGLPGSPLWLAALYSPAFKPVNKWWVPPMWLAPGIVVMQFVTIFFPIIEAYQSKVQMRTTMSLIQSWEDRRAESENGPPSGVSSRNYDGQTLSGSSTSASSRKSRELYSMTALEKALSTNPLPLLEFAATKDFTAENILFLMRVRQYRTAWAAAPRVAGQPDQLTTHATEQMFRMAVEIYVSSIHEQTTDFPINIESSIRAKLDVFFSPAIPEGKKYLTEDVGMDPFGPITTKSIALKSPTFEMQSPRMGLDREYSDDSAKTLWDEEPNSLFPTSNLSPRSNKTPGHNKVEDDNDETILFEPNPCVVPLGHSRANIREGFGGQVFDAAERSVKYLVLTNTWQKFVKSAESSRTSSVLGDVSSKA